MTVQDITTLISTVGFPIVCCGALFWMQNTTLKEVKNSIDNNTKVVEKMLTVLDYHVKGDAND